MRETLIRHSDIPTRLASLLIEFLGLNDRWINAKISDQCETLSSELIVSALLIARRRRVLFIHESLGEKQCDRRDSRAESLYLG